MDGAVIALLEDPSDELLGRVIGTAAATGVLLSEEQAHDICQALADEILYLLTPEEKRDGQQG